jgi:D-tyrosyl-tRNA(Tyr) deacylase
VRVVLQRVTEARVIIDDRVAGQIGKGMLLLTAFRDQDDAATLAWMAHRIRGLRVFTDEDGKMNRSVEEVGGELLVVSQFTLYGDARKGRRPSFIDAARPEVAIPLYEEFVATLREGPCPVRTGEFGAAMRVELVNDGPVTLIIDR